MSQEKLRALSGTIQIKSRLVSFLYDLLRDHLTTGELEELLQDSTNETVSYTNGFLAQYAQYVANELCSPNFQVGVPKEGTHVVGAIAKDVLFNYFLMVQKGSHSPKEAAHLLYNQLTKQEEPTSIQYDLYHVPISP